MTESKSKIHPLYQMPGLWEKNSHPIWIASLLSLTRNMQKFKFPSKLDKSKEDQIRTLLFESMLQCPELQKPVLYNSESLGFLEKEFLLERFLIEGNFQGAQGKEGFVVDEAGDFLGVLNAQDHLNLNLIDTKQEIEKTWSRLAKIEGYIGKRVDFAFNHRYGFLTSNPRSAGTGLVITLYFHIPAIIHMGDLSELLDRVKEDEIEAFGLQGNINEIVGDILICRNRCTLGLTEEYILTAMRMWATKTVIAETNLRKKIIEGNDEPLKNKITRALGLLTHSYQLEAIEALNAVSLVKLGIEIGWINVAANLNMNQVTFNCRRAHLINFLGEQIDIPDLPKKRAEYFHKIAKQLTLAIKS